MSSEVIEPGPVKWRHVPEAINNVVDVEKIRLLQAPFVGSDISKKPKPTQRQKELLKQNSALGIVCKNCGGWHHKDVVHLDYVGHAAITNRLLQVDPMWNWRPLSLDEKGLPRFDENGGMWMELTVLGISRIGYGDRGADFSHRDEGDRIKEAIGDGIRNAGMRFGMALELWHKGNFETPGLTVLDEGPKQKPVLTPNDIGRWESAKKAFLRDGNLEKVLERVDISLDHQKLLMNQSVEGRDEA